MAQSTDKILEQLIINQMPRSVYNAKKAAGELDPEQVYLPDAAYDDSLGVTDATPGQIIKVKTVQDGKPTEWEAVDDRLPKVSPSDAGNVLGVEQIGEFEYGYALTHMPTLSDFIPLGITNASPGQFAKVSLVDDLGGPTAWEAADIYEKPDTGIPKSDLAQSVQTSLAKADTAISLGLTAATPGQIIKVKTVQDGKPTEWEAVDMPSGGAEWYEVIDMETAENVNDLIISTDKNGRPISGYHALEMVLCFEIPADSTQTSTNGNIWVYPMANNYLSSGLRIITSDAGWKTITRTYNYFYAGSNRAIFVSGANGGNIFDGSYNNVFDGVRLFINNAGDHLPAGTKVRCLVLSKGWTA